MNKKEQNNKCGFMKKHGKKILVAAGTCAVTGVVYAVCKRELKLTNDISTLNNTITELEDAKHTLMAACSENLFEEAIATTTRKLNYRQDKLVYINQRLSALPNDIDAVNIKCSLTTEIQELSHRLDLFNAAQQIYKIEEARE